jgi:hypothetical protein
MDIIDALHKYTPMSDVAQVYKHGNSYLDKLDSKFSKITTVRIVPPPGQ